MSEWEQSPDETADSESRRRRSRRRWWIAGLLLALLALALTPPMLNANRLSRRIASNMSQSLGRPVHLDRVSLHILPMPGVTLENLVVSEDPAFGAEPVIRANVVTASIRVSSLWRRHVEFGTIRFIEPSVNLVRLADGRWNLESILLRAAQQETAPTAQQTAGPTPRFPYIEATGARVNVKMGDEKKPFALTEADFALWLPSPQQWRVRLEAKPTRTDTTVSDTGILTMEATLQRAAKLADVSIELSAAWRRAPLGEASRMVTGGDAGWRGDVDVAVLAQGTLGDAAVTGTLKLNHVRRADFIPAQMLSVDLECSGHLAVMAAIVREPACSLETPDTRAMHPVSGRVAATADLLDLSNLQTKGLRLGMTQVSGDWLLDWSRLFSQRIPADLYSPGYVSGSIAAAGGSGDLQGEFHNAAALTNDAPPAPVILPVSVTFANGVATLAAINIAPLSQSPVVLAGSATRTMLTMRFSGAVTVEEAATLRSRLPPLGDGTEELTTSSPLTVSAVKIDILCTRAWGGPQTCTSARAVEPTKKPRR